MADPTIPDDARPIVSFEDARDTIPGHAVRADGTVLYHDARRRKWLPLKVKTGPGGFRKVRLRVGGRVREIGVALLVLRAYAGPRPYGCEPLHYPDPDPGNNHIENLRWAPRGTSKVGRLCSGRPPVSPFGDGHPHAVLSESDVPEVRRLYRAGLGYKEIAEKYDVADETIRHLLRGDTWSHVPDPDGPIAMRRRGPGSEDSPNARLDWGLVREIRGHLRAGMSCRKVAALYEMSYHTIKDISCGRTWKEG